MKGVSVIAPSGDDGAFDSTLQTDPSACGYNPIFPASNPQVTAVGSTMGPESFNLESACQADKGGVTTSGGGFSYYYNLPSWQTKVVSTYLQSNSPNGLYNSNGRGIPDVSLLGYNYDVYVGGNPTFGGGTSASAAAFAAMVSLINAERLRSGKGPIGFLNIVLYQSFTSWANDITVGDNSCSAGTSPNCCSGFGFNAAVGWDPVTGLGSVDFNFFSNYLTSISSPSKIVSLIDLRS